MLVKKKIIMKYLKLYEDFENYSDISRITIRFSSESKQIEFHQKFIMNEKKPGEVSFLEGDNFRKLKFDESGLVLEKNRFHTIALVENSVSADGRNNFKENSDLIYLILGRNIIYIVNSNEHTKRYVRPQDDFYQLGSFKKNSPSDRDMLTGHAPSIYCEFKNGLKVGEVDHRGYFEIISIN